MFPREANYRKGGEMTEQEFIEYIKSRRYYCELCSNLKDRILKEGISALRNYDGFICGGIQDMKLRLVEEKCNG